MADLEQTRTAWDTIASGYDEFVTPTHMGLGEDALRHAGLRADMRLLDVAAGSGALSIPAARAGAQVLSVDIAPTMVERLQARARQEGLNLDARAMDGHALELEDNTFDVSGSQFGVMLFSNLPLGLRELARVTKPGGRVLIVVFGPPAKIEFLGFFLGAIRAVVPDFPGLPMDPLPLPFRLQDPEKLRQELANAGLKEIRVETITEEVEFQSGLHLWNWLTSSNPIAVALVADLTDEQRVGVQHALDDLVRERAGGSGLAKLTNPVHIGIGTK